MDTSMSKALIMVAGVLLAMIVIAFMAHSFSQMGQWATTEENELLIEQKQEFNKEYEVYDKELMYGVDVISCLNKALSDNKRITEERFVNGEKYDKTYEIKVKISLSKQLEESITVYYMKGNNEFAYSNGEGPSSKIKLKNVGFEFINKDYMKFSKLTPETDLKTIQGQKCNVSDTSFELTAAEVPGKNEANLRNLLSLSNTISETVSNLDKENSAKEGSWTKAEFKSALYDLKTRRFKCKDLKYSEETGRVNYIEFKEMKKH